MAPTTMARAHDVRRLIGADVNRLIERMERCEEKLAAQRVCVLKVSVESCTVAAELAGAKVKLKCRGSASKIAKSKVCQVPAGGGRLGEFDELTTIYEGGDALHFELCKAHQWLPSTVVAAGSLSLPAIFGAAGLEGDTAWWSVQLMSKDLRAVGSLDVNIRCETGSLDSHGGVGALRALSLAARPDPALTAAGGKGRHVVALQAWEYSTSCSKASVQLQTALATALTAARASDHDVSRVPGAKHAL